MADSRNTEKKANSLKIKLLRAMALAPEARTEEKKGAYPGGRFKRFTDIFKANNQDLMMVNVFTILFALPMLAVVLFVTLFGAEKFAYVLKGITETPYLMSGLGFGLSSGVNIAEIKVLTLMSYRIMILGIAIFMPVLGVGVAGAMHVIQKFIWGERLLTKKDKKTGVDVNRTITEFFRGVKLYWKQMVVLFSVYAVFIAGGAELILEFIAGLWSGSASVGHWFAVIFGAIFILLSSIVFLNMLPQVVSYGKNLTFIEMVRNALIYTVAFFVPSFFIAIFMFAPIALFAVGGFVTIIVVILFMSVGASYMCLVAANYGDYNSENVLQVLYEQKQTVESRKSRKDKKKDTAPQGSVNYKRKKK